jgi:hypothetical protein
MICDSNTRLQQIRQVVKRSHGSERTPQCMVLWRTQVCTNHQYHKSKNVYGVSGHEVPKRMACHRLPPIHQWCCVHQFAVGVLVIHAFAWTL